MEDKQHVCGRCFCGKVQFEIQTPVINIIFCHCNLCRQANGSDYTTWVRVSRESFDLRRGEMELVRSEATTYASNYFCIHCGTTIYTEDIRYPNFYSVLRGVIRDELDQQPSQHFFYDSKLPWVEFNDSLPKFGGKGGREPL